MASEELGPGTPVGDLMTIREASALLGITRQAVLNYVGMEYVRTCRVHGRVLLDRGDVNLVRVVREGLDAAGIAGTAGSLKRVVPAAREAAEEERGEPVGRELVAALDRAAS